MCAERRGAPVGLSQSGLLRGNDPETSNPYVGLFPSAAINNFEKWESQLKVVMIAMEIGDLAK